MNPFSDLVGNKFLVYDSYLDDTKYLSNVLIDDDCCQTSKSKIYDYDSVCAFLSRIEEKYKSSLYNEDEKYAESFAESIKYKEKAKLEAQQCGFGEL